MEFGYFGDMRLHKNNTFFRVDTGSQPVESDITDVTLNFMRILECCKSMNIDDTVDAIIFFLQFNIVVYCSQQVPDMLPGGRAGAREDAFVH